MKKLPRVIIAGTSSGSGKTTTVCGLLGILKNKGLNTVSYKCGPDYIDPMFHSKVIGVKAYNLDLFFHDKQTVNNLLSSNNADIAVIEGVMGFYDGMSVGSEKASTYDLSQTTNTPAILVINCKAMANSIVAMIKGFYTYRENNVKGVILNNITVSTYEQIKKCIEVEFDNKIKVLGYMSRLPEDLILESRHLGLKTANEIEDIKLKLSQVADILSNTLDIDGIIEIANSADDIDCCETEKTNQYDVNIAVAYDSAFCFYYKETFENFRNLGANIKFFSPLSDEKLPENIDGIYLGGGYPELYLEQLSGNVSMKNSIKKALENEIPCIAECGGFMYLTEKIEGRDMVGFIKAECSNTKKLVRFGYVTLTPNEDNLICDKGESVKGHEFHYYDTTNNGDSFTATKINKLSWTAVHSNENLYAGFPHVSFSKKTAEKFINRCNQRKEDALKASNG